MGDLMLRLGYCDPIVEEEKLTDGSIVYNVVLKGDYQITIRCISEPGAEALKTILYNNMVSIDIEP